MAFVDKGTCPIEIDVFYLFCCGKDWHSGIYKAVMGLTLNKAKRCSSSLFVSFLSVKLQAQIGCFGKILWRMAKITNCFLQNLGKLLYLQKVLC